MRSSEIFRHQLSLGMYSRVATKLGLGPNGRSTVRRVANRQRTSARVTKALQAEIAAIERKVTAYEQRIRKVAA